MSRITSIFTQAKHTALIPYVTVGYPDVKTTLEIVHLFARTGCDLVELGIPFSDPLADGATIQHATYHALKQGVTPKLCLDVAQELRQKAEIPLVLMSYYNPLFKFGLENFCFQCFRVGIDGLIVPDLPPEEGEELEEMSKRHGIDLIYLIAPTSSEKRIELICQRSQGFIYLVSLTGVTGARERLPEELETFVAKVRGKTAKPLCVGFGVSSVEHARRIARIANGVIIGSRILQLLDEDNSLARVRSFIETMREALQ